MEHHPLKPILLSLTLLLFPLPGAADEPDSITQIPVQGKTGVCYKRLALVGVGGGGAHYVAYRYLDRTWWQGKKLDHIRFINDWSGDTYLNMDKFGHFFSGIALAEGIGGIYAWVGFSPRTSTILGSLTSLGELFLVEMRDGRFDQWGFSIPDFTANVLGAAVPLVHTLFPGTQAVRFKMSYFPSALYRDRARRKASNRPHYESIIDDYEGMTFWMTLDMERLLWHGARSVWPDWLGLGVGVGARGMHGSNKQSKGPNRGYPELLDAQHEIFLALDFNADHLPGSGKIWRRVKSALRFVHLPAPAVRIYPEKTFYLLYF